MPKSTNYDFLTFFYCILAGVFLCIVLDLFSEIRTVFKLRKSAVFFLDLFFFIIAGFITFFMQYVWANGQIRWYIFVGEGCGFLSGRMTVSFIDKKLFSLIYKLIHFVFSPIFKVLKTIKNIICNLFLVFAQKILKNIKKVLKMGSGLVYNIVNRLFFNTKQRRKQNGKKKRHKQK